MTKKIPGYYIACQLCGWSLLPVGLYLLIGSFSIRQLVYGGAGLLATHILRNRIIRYGLLTMPPRKGLPRLTIGLVLASTLGAVLYGAGYDLVTWRTPIRALEYAFFILPWTLIYCLHHYVQKTRKEERESRRLALLLADKQQQAEGAAMEIGSIIESLTRIRTLIDEDPGRSRAEITAFSQLLRKGYLNIPPDGLPLS